MRVLCCLDGTNAGQVSKATEMLSASQPLTFGILYVIDTGPRKDIEHLRERFLRPPGRPLSREDEIDHAEHAAAKEILDEGLRYFPDAETLQRQGRPEREIVNIAAEWQADLVVTCPRAEYGGKPTIGTKSVGHVARFVLDHAPCPVLLVRPLAREQFPLAK
jgi:nucleotide-binding universal stress UspA family protein